MGTKGGVPGLERPGTGRDWRSGASRRGILASATALALGGRARAEPASLPDAPTLLVAGPPGSAVDRWAAVIAGPLGRSLLQSSAVARQNIGGPDGVTGANHYQASTPPDGATALIMPGATSLSWMVGDPRVRFDAGRWAPLWGGQVSTVAFCRTVLTRGRRMRVAVQDLIGPGLAALLTLELLGIDAEPVTEDLASAALLDRPDIDVVLLRGTTLAGRRPTLAARHWRPCFSLGSMSADGRFVRDKAFPDIPLAQELVERQGAAARTELATALRPVVAASVLDVALVLPILAPAAVMAWWRQGCTSLSSAPDVQAKAAEMLVDPVDAGPIAASLATITTDAAILLALRRWLTDRHHWRPA